MLLSIMVHITMNYMTRTRRSSETSKKPKKSSKSTDPTRRSSEKARLKAFADSVGDFIRYWGFRRIHGQIWTVIYLSNKPLSGVELTRTLGVSKALVSPALGELLSHKLILNAGGDLKTKLYIANPDVISVIADVLQTREVRLLDDAQSRFTALSKAPLSKLPNIDFPRLTELGSMIAMARSVLDLLLQNIRDRDLRLLNSMMNVGKA